MKPMGAVVFSAYVSNNDVCFERLMSLHVDVGATVADVTYGRGNFWKRIPPNRYTVLKTDIKDGIDCRALPYDDSTIDCVVMDLPYVAGFFRPRKIGEGYKDFTDRYSRWFVEGNRRYHDGVVALHYQAAMEAYRVLKPQGVLVVKCQDEIHAGKQHLTHVELIDLLSWLFDVKDLFVVVRHAGNFGLRGRAKGSLQQHARKNHSYFIVFKVGVRSGDSTHAPKTR